MIKYFNTVCTFIIFSTLYVVAAPRTNTTSTEKNDGNVINVAVNPVISSQNVNNNDAKLDCYVRFPKPNFDPLHNLWRSSQNNINNACNTAYNSILENPLKTIATVCFASYIVINYQIKQTNNVVADFSSWCNWKSIMPLSHLQQTNTQETAQQLKIDIYKKYALEAVNASTCDYTYLFINDLKQEIHLMENYLYWHALVYKVNLQRICCFSYSTEAIEEKKSRLFFILDLFMCHFSKNRDLFTIPSATGTASNEKPFNLE